MSNNKPVKVNMWNVPFKERCYSMCKFEGYLKDFLKTAEFPLKQKNRCNSGISRENVDSFYIKNGTSTLDGTISIDAYDSNFFSTKIITYAEKEDHFSGLISLSFKVREENPLDYPFDDSNDKKHSKKEEESPFLFSHKPKKCEYTHQKEWIVGMEGDMQRYDVTNNGDFIVLRNKVVAQFAKDYLSTLKNFMKNH